jgi:uncharacterized protein
MKGRERMSNTDTIKAVYAAFAKGDIAGVTAQMAPEIVWNEAENFPYADNNPYIGADAVVKGVFARVGADWKGFTIKTDEILDAGDTVVALGRYVGAHRTTGQTINAQIVHVWRLKNGKITAFQQYADTLQVARAAGR